MFLPSGGVSRGVRQVGCGAQVPKTVPLKWREKATLAEMLQHFHTLADTLYYEVLDLPLPQLEQLKTLRARGPETPACSGIWVRVRAYALKPYQMCFL